VNKHVASYKVLESHNASVFLDALRIQPLSVSIQPNQSAFQFYSSGLLANDGSCGDQLDHAVLAIGMGHESGKNYILVRNSWGPSWG